MEILIEFKDQILTFLNFIIPIAIVAFMTLGFVSIIGRLLGLIKTDRSKNIIASFFLLILSFAYEGRIHINIGTIWPTLELASLSAIFYVAVCWRFYPRIDALFDKKIGEDNFEPTIKEKKKDRKK